YTAHPLPPSSPTRRSSDLDLLRRERWSIGVGVGPVETPLPEQTRAGRGPAFEHARIAVERAKNAPGQVAAEGDDTEATADVDARSEEHTSELQSREKLVCR